MLDKFGVDFWTRVVHCLVNMRNAKNYELSEMSKLLATCKMTECPQAASMCSESHKTERRSRWGYVSYARTWDRWLVKMTLGRAGQIILAQTTCEENAIRFADMAQLYFWKYRHRRPKPVCDADMNVDVETAKRELANNSFVTGILKLFESHLLRLKLLDPCEDAPIEFSTDDRAKLFEDVYRLLCCVSEFGLKDFPGTKLYLDTVRPMFEDVAKVAKEMAKRVRETSQPETFNVETKSEEIVEAQYKMAVRENPVRIAEERAALAASRDEDERAFMDPGFMEGPASTESIEDIYSKLGLRNDTTNTSTTQ